MSQINWQKWALGLYFGLHDLYLGLTHRPDEDHPVVTAHLAEVGYGAVQWSTRAVPCPTRAVPCLHELYLGLMYNPDEDHPVVADHLAEVGSGNVLWSTSEVP